MSFATCNGLAVLSGSILLPIHGVWVAELTLDGDEDFAGESASIDVAGVVATGSFIRAGSWQGRTEVRIAGGPSGLHVELAAKGYLGVEARVPVTDVMLASGASLNASSDSSALGTLLAFYARAQGTSGRALDAIADAIGCQWRVMLDGSIWIGSESWSESTANYDVLDSKGKESRLITTFDALDMLPGQTIDEGNVLSVVYDLGAMRREVWLADA